MICLLFRDLRKKAKCNGFKVSSPLAATPGCVPFACNAIPSDVAFLTGEKHISLARLVNPTFSASLPVSTVGKSWECKLIQCNIPRKRVST